MSENQIAGSYVPYVARPAGQWDRSFADLPTDLANLVERRVQVWDGLTPEQQRGLAANADAQDDLCREPVLYFQLIVLGDELKARIEDTRRQSRDSVALELRDVADRLESILVADRARVGTEIQELISMNVERSR